MALYPNLLWLILIHSEKETKTKDSHLFCMLFGANGLQSVDFLGGGPWTDGCRMETEGLKR